MPKKLVNCKSCGKEVELNVKICPHCGIENPIPIHKGVFGCVGIIILSMVLFLMLLVTSGNKSITPEKVILVSALDQANTVSFYIGNDQTNYIDVTVKVEHIYPGPAIRSEDSGLSDGLDSSANWEGVSYFSSSKYPTFTEFKILSLNMADKKAVVQIGAKLVDIKSEKYIEFKTFSYEIEGKFFNELTRLKK